VSREPVESFEQGHIEPAGIALIGEGRVAEPVAEHDGAAGESRLDHLGHMLAASGEHQKGFSLGCNRFVGAIKEDRSDFFRERRSARFPGLHGDVPLAT
jgi:hypothetical protein